MHVWTRSGALFVLAAAMSFATVATRDANAAYQQYHARASCAITSVSPLYAMGSVGTLQNNSTEGYMEMACAFTETQSFTKAAVTSALVAYTDNHSGVTGGTRDTSVVAADCVAYSAASGGFCAATVASPAGFGSGTLALLRDSWNPATVPTAATDFAYIYVSLPSREGGFRSDVRGYALSN